MQFTVAPSGISEHLLVAALDDDSAGIDSQSLNLLQTTAMSSKTKRLAQASSSGTGYKTAGMQNASWSPGDAPTEAQLQSMSQDWLFHSRTTSCRGDSFDNTTLTLASRIFLPLLFACSVLAIAMTSSTRRQANLEAAGGKSAKDAETSPDHGGTPDTSSEQAPETAPTAPLATRASSERRGTNIEAQGGKPAKDAEARPDHAGTPETSFEQAPETPTTARLWHLDFARICAVMCVICDHTGGEDTTHRNVGFGLWWALPYLYMTSGVGFMMSRSSVVSYIARLVCVFIVGVSANWTADAITHRDWQHDFGNTVFQMFFVVMLIIMSLVAEPLRLALRDRKEHQSATSSIVTIASAVLWSMLVLCGLWSFVHASPLLTVDDSKSSWARYYAPILKNTPMILVQIGGTLFLSTLASVICTPENTGWVGWLLLPFIYLPTVLIPWDQDAFPHLICLYVFAMVVTAWPLKGATAIGKCVKAYWPFLLMLLCLVAMPDMWGRCDVHPPFATWERFRMSLGELLLAICFVTGSFAPDDPYKVTVWMGKWALYAYCFHIMWYRLLGSPYGALVTMASAVVFYAIHAHFGTDHPERSVPSKHVARIPLVPKRV